jgi:hypothetical protein
MMRPTRARPVLPSGAKRRPRRTVEEPRCS